MRNIHGDVQNSPSFLFISSFLGSYPKSLDIMRGAPELVMPLAITARGREDTGSCPSDELGLP